MKFISENWYQIEIFRTLRLQSKFFFNFHLVFSKIVTKIEVFRNVDWNRDLFQNCEWNWVLLIEIFFWGEILTKFKLLRNWDFPRLFKDLLQSRFWTILTKILIFRNFSQRQKILKRHFLKILSEIKIFERILQIFIEWRFSRHKDCDIHFSTFFFTEIEIFRWFWLKLRVFFQNFDYIDNYLIFENHYITEMLWTLWL